jgi:flavin-binding protein dodecin
LGAELSNAAVVTLEARELTDLIFAPARIDRSSAWCITHETEIVPPAVARSPTSQERRMSVAKVTEITSTSTVSFEDAIALGVARAAKTLRDVKGAWVQSLKVDCKDGKITDYRVDLKITFVLSD